LAPCQKLSPNPQNQAKIELLTFNSKIILPLLCHKNDVSGSLTFRESKLRVINLNLLTNSVLKNLFYKITSLSCCVFAITENDEDKDDDALSAMEESSLSESEDDEIISSIRPSKKVIYSSESDVSDKPSDGTYFQQLNLYL